MLQFVVGNLKPLRNTLAHRSIRAVAITPIADAVSIKAIGIRPGYVRGMAPAVQAAPGAVRARRLG